MTRPDWKDGDILVAKSGKYLMHFWSFNENPKCFDGVKFGAFDYDERDLSSLWLIKHFERDNIFKQKLVEAHKEALAKFKEEQTV